MFNPDIKLGQVYAYTVGDEPYRFKVGEFKYYKNLNQEAYICHYLVRRKDNDGFMTDDFTDEINKHNPVILTLDRLQNFKDLRLVSDV
jgi:hypothetical protein